MIVAVPASLLAFPESPTRQESLSRQAYAALRRAIRESVIVPGVFYSEPQIARALAVSRTPVREALIELAREGVIEKIPQRGFRIRPISDEELEEVFELRALLESYVVGRFTRLATPADVIELHQIIDEQAKASRTAASFLALDERFHTSMSKHLGLRHAKGMLLSLRLTELVAGAAAMRYPARANGVLLEHRAIVEKIAEHDSRGAVRAVRRHIINSGTTAKISLRGDVTGPTIASRG